MTSDVHSILKKPIHTINNDASIAEVVELMLVSNANDLLVTSKDNDYLGLINQQTLQQTLLKMSYYCDNQQTLNELFSQTEITISKTDQLADIAIQSAQLAQHTFPVLENQQLVGAVTRSDILDYLHQNLALCHSH